MKKLKILQVTSIEGKYITTDSDYYPNYIRWEADNWENIMGESTEQVYDCGWLEEMYQEYIKRR